MLRFSGLFALVGLMVMLNQPAVIAQGGSIFSSASLVTTLEDCQQGGLACLEDIPAFSIQDFEFFLDGIKYSGPFPTCLQDTLAIYSYEFLFGKGNAGPYRLDSWVVDGKTYSGVFQTIPDLVDSMNIWDPSGMWTHQPTLFQIQGGNPGSIYSQMSLTVLAINSPAVIGYNLSFIPVARGILVQKGIHELVARNNSAGLEDTLMIIAGCDLAFFEIVQTEVGMTGSACVDLSGLIGTPGLTGNLCPSPNLASQANLDGLSGCINWTGSQVGSDTLCLVTCDAFGFCVQTTYVIQVLYPGGLDASFMTVQEGTTVTLCPQPVSLPGNLISLTNICPEGSGIHTLVDVPAGTVCAEVKGLSRGGPEFACLEVCTDQGFCDTLTYAIQVTFSDTLEVALQALIQMNETFCPDITGLTGDTLSLTNVCPSGSGLHVQAILDPTAICVDFKGILPGEDSLCLLVEDELGNQILTLVHITVIGPTTSMHEISLTAGSEIEFCPDLSELAGDLTAVTNACGASTIGLLDVTLDPVTGCALLSGLTAGDGEVCLVLCDEWGTCDTFLLHVTVLDPGNMQPPNARDDDGAIIRNQILNLQVLLNDQWSGTDITLSILSGSGPAFGLAIVEADQSITYRPDTDYCGEDQFSYILCNQAGCDTAKVVIEIRCEELRSLTAYTGFSPNGDGINDFFTFEGLQDYPANTLEVYNRWGNRILKWENYQGNWDGTWGSLVVPDGTYFYILQPDGHPPLSGYVYIHR